MKDLTAGIISLVEKALDTSLERGTEESGTVVGVSDSICKIYGLTHAMFGELIEFESGNRGIILDIDENYVSVVLLKNTIPVVEQDIAHRTGSVFTVPVGEDLIGRVISPIGEPLDALGDIIAVDHKPIEQVAPGIIDRTPVHQPLQTGYLLVDALIPIGKGQRELLIGNRSTGKTSVVLDTIINQKNKNVLCVYVSIGHRQSDTAKIIHLLQQHGAMEYTIVIDASAHSTALEQYLAPYAGCTIAEYFMNKGRDVLIAYDDLSNHAIAYRELSLVLRRPPGREAYPGDIFYIHSRLLERAGKLSADRGGGSLTALPIIETQGDDISAYIATNLISITDGQIFFDTNLFNNGIRPAVNIGLSVSRVGGAAQTKAMKKVSASLKLELAQYESLSAFAQFGSELDSASQRAIDRGQRAIQLLVQDVHATHSLADEVLSLFLLKENFLNKVDFEKVRIFAQQYCSFVKEMYPQLYTKILEECDFSDKESALLKRAAEEFIIVFIKPTEAFPAPEGLDEATVKEIVRTAGIPVSALSPYSEK